MLAKRIIPCLDVADGRVVKGTNFINIKDAGDPVEIAKRYNDDGADEITFLDISASHDGRATLLHMVEQVANQVFVPLTVGGGVRSIENIRDLLNAGADKVAINSAAISNPDLVKSASEHFGNQCIVVALDAKFSDNDWFLFTHGGRKPTGIGAIEWAVKMAKFGAGELLITSMDKDGTKSGFDHALLAKIAEKVNIPIIASGGVGNLEHLAEGILKGQADAVLAASIFHYGEYTIPQAKAYLQQKNIKVRI